MMLIMLIIWCKKLSMKKSMYVVLASYQQVQHEMVSSDEESDNDSTTRITPSVRLRLNDAGFVAWEMWDSPTGTCYVLRIINVRNKSAGSAKEDTAIITGLGLVG